MNLILSGAILCGLGFVSAIVVSTLDRIGVKQLGQDSSLEIESKKVVSTSLVLSAYIYIYTCIYTVEHIYDACPKYSELGNFRIIAYLYVSDGTTRYVRYI